MIGMDNEIQPEMRVIQSIRSDIALQALFFIHKPQAIPVQALDLLARLPYAT
jgi:hypothetical protein